MTIRCEDCARVLRERGPCTARELAEAIEGVPTPGGVSKAGRVCSALRRWGLAEVVGTRVIQGAARAQVWALTREGETWQA